MKREMICIGCPQGCLTTVVLDGKTVSQISGNRCPIGKKYASEEISSPKRTLTTTIRIQNSDELLPVKSKEPIPKDSLFLAMEQINLVLAKAPVKVGDILIEDLVGTGIPLVSTGNIY